MAFEHSTFIKSPAPFIKEYTTFDPAPLFRKTFHLPYIAKRATLSVCGLGYGYWYLNGISVSNDLFTAPISDYTKTLWYNVYDVTKFLHPGENVAAAILGNGFYNESLDTPWNLKDAGWRDQPKLIFELKVECEEETRVIVSDESWKCSMDGPVTYHQLHNGEYYDACRFDPNWNCLHFDESQWTYSVKDSVPPTGVFRRCECEPIQEAAEYPALSVRKTPRNTWIFDIGQNISGYIRLKIHQKRGDIIWIRYAEQINEDLTLQHNHMEEFYPTSAFETDRFICSGKMDCWSPRFTYHGFRYIELEGLDTTPDVSMVTGMFVHQMVEEVSQFHCSDPFLTKIYKLGKMSTLSNLFYMPTDCPTREKLGWTNDAQASTNQMLMNFKMEKLFDKWTTDILDAMRENGSLPGIVPTSGDWGYECGPVADGVLFEIPWKVYLFTGNDSLLRKCYPSFSRYLNYLKSRADDSGLVGFGLADWAGPFKDLGKSPTPVTFIGTVFYIRLAKIAEQTAALLGDENGKVTFHRERNEMERLLIKNYCNSDGSCKVHEHTAISLLIHHGLYSDLEPLKKQLIQTIEEHDFHHYCGMVGLRHLYYALDICGCQDIALRVIKAKGYPGYRQWIEQDATTLWETWQPYNSKNHHMYSDVLYWMMKNLVGISPSITAPGFRTVILSPYIPVDMEWCEGSRKTQWGTIFCRWEKDTKTATVLLTLQIPDAITAKVSLPNTQFDDNTSIRTLRGGNYHLALHNI